MKKVLFVATVDIHIQLFHIPYLKLFHDNGYEVHVATNSNEEILYCDVKHQICIDRTPFKLNNLKAIKQLRKIINKEKFDIIHCHTPMGSVIARIAAKNARKKYKTRVIYTAHGFHFYENAPKLNWLLFYPIEKWLAKYTDTLITINGEDYKLALKKFIKRCKDIQYVPGVGIDTSKFNIKISNKEAKELKKSFGLKSNDFILTCVARLDKNKNQIFLINIMEELIKKHNNIHLLLVGPDELDGYYQKIVHDKKLCSSVHFLGKRDDIPKILAITDVVLSASKREGLPVNVMEAFSSGKPVVALNCRGMKDLIENGKNGFIIYGENNRNKYIKKIIYIYNLNKSKKESMMKANINKSQQYDISNLIIKYSNIYLKYQR